MTQHNYTHVIDMSDSEAFYAGFYDDVDKVLYLTFKNGTNVSRQAPVETTPKHVEEIESWGQQWHSTLKHLPFGPDVEPGDEFVYRPAPVAEVPAPQDNATVSDDLWFAFRNNLIERVAKYGEEWWIDDYEEELRESLAAAVEPNRNEPTEVANESDDDLAEATRNSEGTFLGIGFIDVPEDVEQRLTSILGFVNEFVRDDLGSSVKGLIQRYDVSQMRDFMRGLR